MKWLPELRYVTFGEMSLPEDWPSLVASARAKTLGASLTETEGPVNLPVLNAATLGVVAGKHRLAGEAARGLIGSLCRMWTGSPEEERVLRAADNAFPREDYDAWIHEMVQARAALIEARRAAGIPDKVSGDKPGPRPGARSEARSDIAILTGKSTEAVRKLDERGAAKLNPKPKLDVRIVDKEGNEARVEAPAEPPPSRPPHIQARDLLELAVSHGDACEETLWRAYHLLKPMQVSGAANGKTPIINSALGGAGEAARLVNEALRQARVSVNDLATIEKNLRKANSAPTEGERLPGEGPRRGLGGKALR